MNHSQGRWLDLPPSLKVRCKRRHGWSEAFCKDAFTAYRQFMKLKLVRKDWDGSQLEPSLTVHKVCDQHIKQVEHYTRACQEYTCGSLINSNPYSMLDSLAQREERIRATKLAFRVEFRQETDSRAWDFALKGSTVRPDDLYANSVGERPSKRSRTFDTNQVAENDVNNTVTLIFRTPNDQETYILLKKTDKMGNAFETYAEHCKQQQSNLSFSLNGGEGESIQPWNTPQTLKLQEYDTIHVYASHREARSGAGSVDDTIVIYVRLCDPSGQVSFVRVKKEATTMAKLFDAFAVKKGVDVSSLSFWWNAKLIERNQTPKSLGLDNYDMIKVMIQEPREQPVERKKALRHL